MERGFQWDEIGVVAKILWWFKFLFFLALALPVSLFDFVFSPGKRRYWAKTWQRVFFVWRVIFWPKLRSSIETRKQAIERIGFLKLDFPHLDLSWEYRNLVRYSARALVVVLMLYIFLGTWTTLRIVKVTPSFIEGVPTPEPTAVLVKTSLKQFQEDYAFQEVGGELADSYTTNLVLILDLGQIRYSPYTFEFTRTEPWKRIPTLLYVSSMQIRGKIVEFEDERGFRREINILQPFVFYQQQKYVYVVDEKGQIWMAQIVNLERIKVTQEN